VRRTRLRRPRSSQLAIPWRDALSTLRAPTRLAWTISLVVAGVIAILAAPDRRVIVSAGLLAGYVAAAKVLEPLRLEADQPEAHHVLSLRWGPLLLLHCVVPVLVLMVPAVVTVIGAWAVSSFGSDAAVSTLMLCPLASAALVLCAAIAAKRGPFPIELLLLGGDVGVVVLVVWLATGPILAALALAVPAGLMYRAASGGISISQATGASVAVLLATLLVAVAYLAVAGSLSELGTAALLPPRVSGAILTACVGQRLHGRSDNRIGRSRSVPATGKRSRVSTWLRSRTTTN